MAEQLVRSLSLGEEGGEQLVMSFRMEGRLHKLAKTPPQGNFTEWVRVLVSVYAHPSLKHRSSVAFSRTRTTTNDAGTDSENELAPR